MSESGSNKDIIADKENINLLLESDRHLLLYEYDNLIYYRIQNKVQTKNVMLYGNTDYRAESNRRLIQAV